MLPDLSTAVPIRASTRSSTGCRSGLTSKAARCSILETEERLFVGCGPGSGEPTPSPAMDIASQGSAGGVLSPVRAWERALASCPERIMEPHPHRSVATFCSLALDWPSSDKCNFSTPDHLDACLHQTKTLYKRGMAFMRAGPRLVRLETRSARRHPGQRAPFREAHGRTSGDDRQVHPGHPDSAVESRWRFTKPPSKHRRERTLAGVATIESHVDNFLAAR